MRWDRVSEAISKDAPIDRQANQALHGRGVHFEAKLSSGEVRSEVPLPLRPVPRSLKDITGQRFGSLTVIGLAAKKADVCLWVLRCNCGYYVHRKGKALKGLSPEGRAIACANCDKTNQLRTHNGNWPKKDSQ